MPAVFYALGILGLIGGMSAIPMGHIFIGISAIEGAIFCIGFGFMISLLERIATNTEPLLAIAHGRNAATTAPSSTPAGPADPVVQTGRYKDRDYRVHQSGKISAQTLAGGWRDFSSVEEMRDYIG